MLLRGAWNHERAKTIRCRRSHRSLILAFAPSCGALENSWIEAFLERLRISSLQSAHELARHHVLTVVYIHIVLAFVSPPPPPLPPLLVSAAALFQFNHADCCLVFSSTLLHSTCSAVHLPLDVRLQDITFSPIRRLYTHRVGIRFAAAAATSSAASFCSRSFSVQPRRLLFVFFLDTTSLYLLSGSFTFRRSLHFHST